MLSVAWPEARVTGIAAAALTTDVRESDPIKGLVPLPSGEASDAGSSIAPRSISQVKRRAEQFFPLLLLGVGEDGFELLSVVLASLFYFRSNLFRFATRLYLFD